MSMWHVETFNSTAPPGEMEAHLKRMLPYWRSRGFNVKVFVTQYSLGPAMFWLCTELNEWDDFSKWPEMATGDEEGQRLMDQLMRMQSSLQASVVKDLEQ